MNDNIKKTLPSGRFPLIAVEGTIGAGKSTLLRWGMRTQNLIYSPEVESPHLIAYYDKPERWALTLQIDMLLRRIRQERSARSMSFSNPMWQERSIWGGYALARANWLMGTLSASEWDLYKETHATLLENHRTVDGILYLDCPMDTALERIAHRAISRESDIDQEYMSAIAESYDIVLRDAEGLGLVVYKHSWDNTDLLDTDESKGAYSMRADAVLSNARRCVYRRICDMTVEAMIMDMVDERNEE